MRLHDWRENFHNLIVECHTKPFEWGEHDCFVGLALPTIKAVLGIDLIDEYRGTYSTALGAMKVIRDRGFDNLGDAIASRFEEIHISHAWAADLVSLEGENTGIALGVVIGERIGVLMPTGYGTIDRLARNPDGSFTVKRTFRID